MRYSEYHMKVRCLDHFLSAFIHPSLPEHSLTLWTVAVAAGVIVYLDVTAVGTAQDIHTESTGPAVKYGMGSLALNFGDERCIAQIITKGELKYPLNGCFRHLYLP